MRKETNKESLDRLVANALLADQHGHMYFVPTFDAEFIKDARNVAEADFNLVNRLVRWLYHDVGSRKAALTIAVEAVRANPGLPDVSRFIDSLILRLDDTIEIFAYWKSRGYGNLPPRSVRNGLCKAINRLADESAVMLYSRPSRGWHLGMLLQGLHVRPESPQQSDLFAYALADYKGRHFDTSKIPFIHLGATPREVILPSRTRQQRELLLYQYGSGKVLF